MSKIIPAFCNKLQSREEQIEQNTIIGIEILNTIALIVLPEFGPKIPNFRATTPISIIIKSVINCDKTAIFMVTLPLARAHRSAWPISGFSLLPACDYIAKYTQTIPLFFCNQKKPVGSGCVITVSLNIGCKYLLETVIRRCFCPIICTLYYVDLL